MWALIVDGSINRIFKVPTAFKHPTTGIQYPRNWLSLATDSEKASVGFIEITESGSYGDSDYYENSESNPVYDASKGTVVITKSKTAKDLAKIKAKSKDFYAAQTREEQFKVKSKIYSESRVPVVRDNATNIANFEVRHRDKPYVQLGFVYSNKTKKFEPNFSAIPSGTITFNPVDNFAYKREGDKFIRLDPITLLPIENVDGTE